VLNTNAFLSHGATANLRDIGGIRGQRNEDYWLQFMQGFSPPAPRVPLVYEKFINQLRSAGINVARKGPQTQVMAMTNKDVQELAGNRALQNAEVVHWGDELKPVVGGLFDRQLTGGHGGRNWSYLPLHEPMLNPVMEEPARRILGLTGREFDEVVSGLKPYRQHGTGMQAIAHALDKLDLDSELASARAAISGNVKTAKDKAIRKLGYLKSAKENDLHPRDWVLDRVPVLPPIFRPVSLMGNGVPLVADANHLYKELFAANKNLEEMKQQVGDEGVGNERLAVYRAFKAVTGLGEPLTRKNQERRVQGALASVFGSSPKYGTVQRKLIGSTVDNVGRGVVTPNADLDMDSVGIPEDSAFEIYGRFLARRLKRAGVPLQRAMQMIEDRHPQAREALMDEMEERPVLVDRAPVLHKFGVLAFKPRLVKGSVIEMSPLVVKGFGMDFDGDTSQFHVVADEDARKEAMERLLPSQSLLSPADFKTPVHMPGNEYVAGLFQASTHNSNRRPAMFKSKADALAAYRQGKIGIGDPVQILEE